MRLAPILVSLALCVNAQADAETANKDDTAAKKRRKKTNKKRSKRRKKSRRNKSRAKTERRESKRKAEPKSRIKNSRVKVKASTPRDKKPRSVLQKDDRHTLGVSVDFVGGSQELDGKLLIGVAESDESFDYRPPLFAYRAWLAWPFWKGKLQTSLAVRFPYEADREENTPDFEFGYLLEPTIAYEHAWQLKKKLDVPVSVRVGIPILIPTGDFNQQIDMLDEVGSIPGPRFGWLVGFSGGLRRQLGDNWGVRFDFHFEFSQIYLFATRASINDTPYAKDWNTNVARVSMALGLERRL